MNNCRAGWRMRMRKQIERMAQIVPLGRLMFVEEATGSRYVHVEYRDTGRIAPVADDPGSRLVDHARQRRQRVPARHLAKHPRQSLRDRYGLTYTSSRQRVNST
jgi:hypothetical protein